MKKFLNFSLFFVLFVTSSLASELSKFKQQSGWSEFELNGKIKSMELTQTWHDNKNKNEKTTVFFNEQGYITKEIVKVDGKKEHSIEYKLNAQNFRLLANANDGTSTKFSYEFGDEVLYQTAEEFVNGKKPIQAKTVVKKFSKDGKILTEQIRSGGYTIAEFHTIYDEKGNKIKEQDGSGMVIFDISYIYDENGNLKQKSLLSPIESKVQYILYDKAHVTLIQNTEMQKPDGSEPALLESWTYKNTVDKNNNLTNVKIYSDDGKLLREDSYKYEYYR
ncbi:MULTISPECIES: hypothetical protein [unclassified Campylobacter]|uniref:hypothetical protein n=1 Tax=unclassified Campylobacter TaxID=2593542 RepID=UPI003D350469